jgi:hypothetical protein
MDAVIYKLRRGEQVLAESPDLITYVEDQYGWQVGSTIFVDPAREFHVVTPNPTEWLIDIGSFFDRFGAAAMSVLASTDNEVQAVVKNVMARNWVDLKRPDVAASLDLLVSKDLPGVDAALKAFVLTTPVLSYENLVLRRLFFS